MEAQDNLRLAKTQQAAQANKHRGEEIAYRENDLVLLLTVHRQREYMQRGSNCVAKFIVRYDGPFCVLKAFPETSTYTLDLPEHMRIFPTFHASLLRPWRHNDGQLFPSHEYAWPGPVLGEEGKKEWLVEKILDRRRRGRGWRFLVKWQGYGDEENSWLPGSEVINLEAYGNWLAENDLDAFPD